MKNLILNNKYLEMLFTFKKSKAESNSSINKNDYSENYSENKNDIEQIDFSAPIKIIYFFKFYQQV